MEMKTEDEEDCEDKEILPDEPPKELDDKLEVALITDNKDEFLRLINEPDFSGYPVEGILEFDCPKIATVLINGEATRNIDDDDDHLLVFKGGWTPMHLACFGSSPRLIEDLIDRGFSVDVRCDYNAPLHFEHVTPLDLALEFIDTGYKYGYGTIDLPWTPNSSIFELLHYVCDWRRPCLEVIRLLVQNTKNKDLVRKAFFKYADEEKLIKLTALFLAVPELFLPSSSLESDSVIEQLYLYLNSLPKNDIQDGILLLLDVFYLVGHKLVAYIRVHVPKDWQLTIFYGKIKIGFFLGEVARKAELKKPGISSLDDYLLRFFKPVNQRVYPRCSYYMNQTETRGFFSWNLFKIKDVDIDSVNRMISRLKPHEADVLKKAINNKLSVMPTIRTVFKDMRIQFRRRKQRRIEPTRVQPFCTKAANANAHGWGESGDESDLARVGR